LNHSPLSRLAGRWIFPPVKRDFSGKRWLKIGLRTLHLIGVAGIGGGYFYLAAAQDWQPFLWLTLGSGVAMVLVELWSHGIWLLQLRGLLILFKLLLLLLTGLFPANIDIGLLLLVLLISGVISHAPSRQRYYSPFYRRKITLDDWSWHEQR
jgi:hypothetical protein